MIKLNDEQLKNIVSELEQGNTCYYDITSGEVLSVSHFDPEEFEKMTGEKSDVPKLMARVNAARDNYIEIATPTSSEDFGFIEDFIETISDGKIKNRLALAIRKRGPFQQFRNGLLDYPSIRQKWFTYRGERLAAYVKETTELGLED